MKLPLFLTALVPLAALSGCGGGGLASSTDWSVELFPSDGLDLDDYRVVVTRNDRAVGEATNDECRTDSSFEPEWCDIEGGNSGRIFLRVRPSDVPYRVYVRRLSGGTAPNTELDLSRGQGNSRTALINPPNNDNYGVWRVFLNNADLLNGTEVFNRVRTAKAK